MAQTDSTPSPPQPNRSYPLLIASALFVAILIAFYAFHDNKPAPTPTTHPGIAAGELAPDFSLIDAHAPDADNLVTLSLLAKKGPVLAIFYLGYSCPRCVENLALLSNLKPDFDKLGIQIIALSPDTPSNTRDSIKTFGDFDFPLLYDKDAKVARAFGLRPPESPALHGTFLIDSQRRIQFSESGEHPYTDFGNITSLANPRRNSK